MCIAIVALAIHWTRTGQTEPAATLLGHLEVRKNTRFRIVPPAAE
jgi:hypothetical protein